MSTASFFSLFSRPLRATCAVAATLALLVAAPRDASAFCRTTTCDPNDGDSCNKNDKGCIRDGVPLKWATSPIIYRFSKDGSTKLDTTAARKAIRRAFGAWTSVQCAHGLTSLRFEEGPEITAEKPTGAKQGSQKFGIYFRDDEWPHDDKNESIALTNQIYGKVSGNIDYADIEINTALITFALTDENREGHTDLQAVITHEVGHYIGFAHSLDNDSIMVARYCQAGNDRCKGGIDRARELSEDDETAVCAAYEPAQASQRQAQGCTQAPSFSRSSLVELATVLGLGFLGIALVRRRLRA